MELITITNLLKKYPCFSRTNLRRLIKRNEISSKLVGKTYYLDIDEIRSKYSLPEDFSIYSKISVISKKLDIYQSTVVKYITSKKVRGLRVLKCWYAAEADFDKYIDSIKKSKLMRGSNINRRKQFEERIDKSLGEEYERQEPFISLKTKIKILHKTCGNIFSASPDALIYPNGKRKRGTKCPYCFGTHRYSIEEVQNIISEHTHGMYKLVSTEYKSNKNFIEVSHLDPNCKGNGKAFKIKLNCLLNDSGKLCPYCNMSAGEERIYNFLKSISADFEIQHRVKINKRTYYFDFMLGNNIFIEYDGQQHFEKLDAFSDFDETTKRDKIKNEYISKNKNLKLYRVSYNNIKEIDSIVNKIINNKSFRDYPLGEYEKILGKGVILSNNIFYIG